MLISPSKITLLYERIKNRVISNKASDLVYGALFEHVICDLQIIKAHVFCGFKLMLFAVCYV